MKNGSGNPHSDYITDIDTPYFACLGFSFRRGNHKPFGILPKQMHIPDSATEKLHHDPD
jgi:hypothetical protein